MPHEPTAPVAPRVSIIVPLYNHVLFTGICVRALAAAPDDLAHVEVLLVDNGSTDGTAAFIGGLSPPFRALTNAGNEGFARACNRGAREAGGEYVLFLNNDTVPGAGWLAALLAAAKHTPAPTIVGARLLFPDDTVQHAGIGFNERDEPAHLVYGFPANDPAAITSRAVPAVTGACLLMRRDAFLAGGGFDEGYHNGYEDLDLCCRVRRDGGTVWYAADSTLYHFESATAGRYLADAANATRFRERWGAWLATDALARASATTTTTPVRLARTYATGADMRRELERVIADARAYESEFIRLDAAYRELRTDFDRQEAWARGLEADARRLRARNPLQRLAGRVLRM